MFLIQLPNGVTQSQATYQDRFGKLQEHLRQLTLLFKKLRLLYERCVEMTSDLKEGPAEVREDLCWLPPKKEKQTNIFFNYYYITTVELCSFFMSDLIMRKKKCNFNRDLPRLCVQLVPYAGEELVSVRVEPCSPAVIQERNEVLEVGFCNVLVASGNHQQWRGLFLGGVKLK